MSGANKSIYEAVTQYLLTHNFPTVIYRDHIIQGIRPDIFDTLWTKRDNNLLRSYRKSVSLSLVNHNYKRYSSKGAFYRDDGQRPD